MPTLADVRRVVLPSRRFLKELVRALSLAAVPANVAGQSTCPPWTRFERGRLVERPKITQA